MAHPSQICTNFVNELRKTEVRPSIQSMPRASHAASLVACHNLHGTIIHRAPPRAAITVAVAANFEAREGLSSSEARGLLEAVRQLRVLLPEELPHPVHAAEALLHVVLAVPEGSANAFVGLDVVLGVVHAWPGTLAARHGIETLLVGGLPPILVGVDAPPLVQDARQVIHADLAGVLRVVGALPGAVDQLALASGHGLHALIGLGTEGLAWASAWKRVPNAAVEAIHRRIRGHRRHPRNPPQLAEHNLRLCLLHLNPLVVTNIIGDAPIEVLATHDEAVPLPSGLALRRCALRRIKSKERPELLAGGVVELLRVLHRDLVPQDSSDSKLAWNRSHNLVVQVPHQTGQICRIDVLWRIVILALCPVHVEGHLRGTRGLQAQGHAAAPVQDLRGRATTRHGQLTGWSCARDRHQGAGTLHIRHLILRLDLLGCLDSRSCRWPRLELCHIDRRARPRSYLAILVTLRARSIRALSVGRLVDGGLEFEQAGLRCEAGIPLGMRVDTLRLRPPSSLPTRIANHRISAPCALHKACDAKEPGLGGCVASSPLDGHCCQGECGHDSADQRPPGAEEALES
mmetsp:Transcript_55503/g.144788  ORF Transcript_55503/g.144788 Transcript_55503/m.144788 type:complete len:574 (+) Transcript_55503:39-1760(+)